MGVQFRSKVEGSGQVQCWGDQVKSKIGGNQVRSNVEEIRSGLRLGRSGQVHGWGDQVRSKIGGQVQGWEIGQV